MPWNSHPNPSGRKVNLGECLGDRAVPQRTVGVDRHSFPSEGEAVNPGAMPMVDHRIGGTLLQEGVVSLSPFTRSFNWRRNTVLPIRRLDGYPEVGGHPSSLWSSRTFRDALRALDLQLPARIWRGHP